MYTDNAVSGSSDNPIDDGLLASAAADDPHPRVPRPVHEALPGRARATAVRQGTASRSRVTPDVFWALKHPEVFSSKDVVEHRQRRAADPAAGRPSDHTKYRRLLNPQFVPRAIEELEPEVRGLVSQLIDNFAARGSLRFPRRVRHPAAVRDLPAAHGSPAEDLPLFLKWRDQMVRPESRQATRRCRTIRRRRRTRSASTSRSRSRRREQPDDGLLSQIVQWQIDGEPLSEPELLGMSHLLLIGGLDTVTATLDCMIAFLRRIPITAVRSSNIPTASPRPSKRCFVGSLR